MKSRKTIRFLSAFLALCMLWSVCGPAMTVRAAETETVLVSADFESDTIDSAPAGFTLANTSDTHTVTVVADPKDENNKVMLLKRSSGQTGPSAKLPFTAQTGKVSVQYRMMIGADMQYAAILYSGTTQGPYIVSRLSTNTSNPGLQACNGSSWVSLFDTVQLNEWYTVEIDADASTDTFDVSITDPSGTTKTGSYSFRNSTDNLDNIHFEIASSGAGALYIDDVKVTTMVEASTDPTDPEETDPEETEPDDTETDQAAPVWSSGALKAENVTDTGAELSFAPAVDALSASKYEVLVNSSATSTIDFTSVEEKTFTLPNATVNSTGQGTVYLVAPKNIPEGVKLPVVIGLHGNNGSASVFQTHTGIYGEIKDIALQNGYIFAAISNGTDIWGQNNDAGVDNVKLLLDYLVENYNAQSEAVLWAYSAGGVLANRMVMKYPDSVSFVLGIYPVYDLADMYANYAPCTNAWGADAGEAIAAINPAANPSAFTNHKIYLTHGDADTTVTLAAHSQAMQNAVGSNVKVAVVSGGTHDSSNFNYLNDTLLSGFSENPATVSCALSGLTAGTAYTASVRATDASGNAASSNTVSFTTTGTADEGDDSGLEIPEVAFDFEEDTLNGEPKYLTLSGVTSANTITVVADPADAENQVLLLNDTLTTGDAVKADVVFEGQTGEVTATFRMRIGSASRFIINMMSDSTSYLGSRILLETNGDMKYRNGSSWVTFGTYELNTWYDVKIVANVSTNTYALYVNDAEIATGISFESTLSKVNILQFATFGANSAEVYIDDVDVPEPPEVLYYTPEYMVEELLHDSKYLCFPSILKLSDEKVIIVYKAGTSHMNDESSMDVIVYNPKTEMVVSRTVIDGTVGENAQNPEIMQMPNGDLMIYLDVQRTTSSGTQRYGVKQFRSTDQGQTWKVLDSDGTYQNVEDVEAKAYKILTDTSGIQYGYTFDDVTVDGTVYMLAMTFAELSADYGRSVHIIKSTDNGVTWDHVKNLTADYGFAFNESTLEPCGDGYMIVVRGDSGAKPRAYITDENFELKYTQNYSEYSDTIVSIGRPKLFVQDGNYYLLCRNVVSGATTLAVYQLDPETLAPVTWVELKHLAGYSSGNSFYAEYYMQQKHGQTFFNVITYADTNSKGNPDIFRYEYAWDEIKNQQPVAVAECTYDQNVAAAAYLKTEGTCQTASTYYKSCTCGAAGETTAFVGSTTDHSWGDDGVCTVCGETKSETTTATVTLKYPTLSLKSEVRYNIYFAVTGVDGVESMTEQMGLVYWNSEPTDENLDTPDGTVAGADYNSGADLYVAHTNGIPAKNLADKLYFKTYIQLSDGTRVYSELQSYSAKRYAEQVLGSDESEDGLKALCVAMLNYGAEAQKYFAGRGEYTYTTLMNADLSDADKARVTAYSADMVEELTQVDSSKSLNFAEVADSYTDKYPTAYLKGAFALNYYFKPSAVPADGVTLYNWSLADYTGAETLTSTNRTSEVSMTEVENGYFKASYSGISARKIGETVFAAAVYEADGTTYCSGVIPYSLARYCKSFVDAEDAEMKDLAAAIIVYGYYAKAYFPN